MRDFLLDSGFGTPAIGLLFAGIRPVFWNDSCWMNARCQWNQRRRRRTRPEHPASVIESGNRRGDLHLPSVAPDNWLRNSNTKIVRGPDLGWGLDSFVVASVQNAIIIRRTRGVLPARGATTEANYPIGIKWLLRNLIPSAFINKNSQRLCANLFFLTASAVNIK